MDDIATWEIPCYCSRDFPTNKHEVEMGQHINTWSYCNIQDSDTGINTILTVISKYYY